MSRWGHPLTKTLLGLAVALASLGLLEMSLQQLLGDDDTGFGDQMLALEPASGELKPSFWVRRGARLEVRHRAGDECIPFSCRTALQDPQPGDLRLACFGGSTTVSEPGGDLSGNFCSQLGAALQRLLPQRNVKTFVLGGVGISSRFVVPLVSETARLIRFDLWVLYMGHNEFIHSKRLLKERQSAPPGDESTPTEDDSAPARGLASTLKSLALVRVLEHVVGGSSPTDESGLRRYSDNTFQQSDSFVHEYDRLTRRYESNLEQIIALAARYSTPLVISELVANLGWQRDPSSRHYRIFDSRLTDQGLEKLQEAYKQGVTHEKEGRHQLAIKAYARALKEDARYIPGIIRMGSCRAALGDREAALALYLKARQENRFPIVAPPHLLQRLRQVCRDKGVPLAPVTRTFQKIYLEQPEVYGQLFEDDCHPTARGHGIIADKILKVLIREGMLGLSAPALTPAAD